MPGLANIKSSQKNQLVKRLLSLDADYLVLDLGAGTGSNILDFFLMSTHGIVVTAPTLTATLNAYLFLKNAVFRLLYGAFGQKSRAFEHMESLRKDGASLRTAYIPAILDQVRELDPERWAIASERMARFRPRLLMNMLEDPKDAEKAQKIRRSCKEYLNIDIEHLGVLYRDEMQDVALGSRIPIIRYKPQSVLSPGHLPRRRQAHVLRGRGGHVPLPRRDRGRLPHRRARGRGRLRRQGRLRRGAPLLRRASPWASSSRRSASQQFEIDKLRRENQFLKYKLTKALEPGLRRLGARNGGPERGEGRPRARYR